MEKYMHGITIVRNLCAHGSRLFNRLFITKPTLNQKELQLLNKTSTGVPDNGRLFGYVLNMRRLLSLTEFTAFKAQLTFLCAKYPFVDMRYYGFCPNWEEIL